eukprot:7386326-Prymnesium_polylepis.2
MACVGAEGAFERVRQVARGRFEWRGRSETCRYSTSQLVRCQILGFRRPGSIHLRVSPAAAPRGNAQPDSTARLYGITVHHTHTQLVL